jgi:hypothetical protein
MTKFVCSLLCLALFSIQNSEASHVIGAEIQWKHIEAWKYEISLVYYRDCRANIALQNADLIITPSDTTIKNNSLHTARLRSITNVSNQCSSNTEACFPSNKPNGGRGIEKIVYTDTIDFNQNKLSDMRNMGVCSFTINYRQCCRSAEINTITNVFDGGTVGGGSSYLLFIDAQIEVCNPDNKKEPGNDNSPSFSLPPILNTCCNQAIAIHTGMVEKDGDSLVFSLVPVQYNFNATIPLIPGLDGISKPLHVSCLDSSCDCTIDKQEVNGFCFDAKTGIIRFSPIFCNEKAVLALKVDQFKRKSSGNWEYAGFIKRDWVINVSNCNDNNAPLFETIAPLSVCAGDSVCVPFFVSDLKDPLQEHLDTLDIEVYSSLPSYSIELQPPFFDTTSNEIYAKRIGKICWETTHNDPRQIPYLFTLVAFDKGCPYARMGAVQSQILVSPSIDFKIDSIKGPYTVDSSLRIYTYKVEKQFDHLSFDWTIHNGTILEGNNNAEVKVEWLDSLINKTGALQLKYTLHGKCSNQTDSLAIAYKSPIKPILYSSNLMSDWGIHIYPNPTYSVLHINSEVSINKIQILDISGQIHIDQPYSSEIELMQLKTGLYFIRLATAEGMWAHFKFLKL